MPPLTALGGRAALALRRAMLRTGRGPLRPLWTVAHEAAIRGVVRYLRRADEGAAAYTGGSFGFGEPVYGVSDIDLVLVLPDGRSPGRNRERVQRRWQRAARALPLASELFDLDLYEEAELRDAVSSPALTYALDGRADGRGVPAVYGGRPESPSRIALQERPRLYGPTHGWRLVAGPDRRPPAPIYDPQSRRIAAWAQLQGWWAYAFRASLNPSGPRTPYLCTKLIAEPVRSWLWLARGEQVRDYREALDRALRLLPEEEPVLLRALALHRALPRSPAPPLDEILPGFVRLSSHLARRIAAEIEEAGTTAVRLDWGDEGELPLPAKALEGLRAPGDGAAEARLVPLVDWRARALPSLPDEALALLPGDPGDPARLAAAALLDAGSLAPGLLAQGLLVLPTDKLHGGRARLRAVQCPPTDPVSFALSEGRRHASFPNVPGWSAEDSARRALAEYRAWLAANGRPATLALLLNAARAALFLESVEEGDPELPLTMAATARRLGERDPRSRERAERAYEAYRAVRLEGAPLPRDAVDGLIDVVRELPAYHASANGHPDAGNGRRAKGEAAARPPTPAADPTVSVVVAAYNEEQHIGRLLASLRRQTLPPVEVVVADDGSRDRTAAIAEAEGARVLRLSHRGPAVARNAGASVARGDVLVFVDGDMACAPEFVERLVDPIARGETVGTFSRDIYLGNPDNPWARAYAALRGSPPGRRLLRAELPHRWENFRAIRRDRFLSVGGYDDVGYGEDMTLAPKLGELALAAPGATCFHYQPTRPGEVFENARWIGRGIAIRQLRNPWRTHSPWHIVTMTLRRIAGGHTLWTLPAGIVFQVGAWLGLAESAVAPGRHWK